VKNGTCEEVITKSVLREVFHVDAVIGKDPRTKKPMCLTYNLWRGERNMMRNNLVWTLLLGLLLIVSACAGDKNNQTDANEKREETETTVYEAENGDIEVPKDPARVVMLSGFTGNVLELGVDVVGADVWSMDN